MQFAIDNKDLIIRMYVIEKKTTTDIAEVLGTYRTKVSRCLKFLGIKTRSKDEVCEYMRSRQEEHPTRGKPMSEATREAIQIAQKERWEDPEKIDSFSKQIRLKWEGLTTDERASRMKSIHSGLRESAKNGSSQELFVVEYLSSVGYSYERHLKELMNERLEIDILMSDYPIVIEVDGPSHYSPIFGQDKLQKTMASDTDKNGILIGLGYSVIRLRVPSGYFSARKQEFIKQQLQKSIDALIGIKTPKIITTEDYQ
jgi:very-short-patch-repair endonuclease